MKKCFIVGLTALLTMTACQSEEVQVEQQQVMKKTVQEVVTSADYTTYQQQYEDALSKIVVLERTLTSEKATDVKVHYEKRVSIWKAYMNDLLDQLKVTMSATQWHVVQAEQERWYPQMELAANKAAQAQADEAKALLAYLQKKESAMQIRARYILDEYYFKQQ